jgi:hypothetical protein
MRGASRKHFLLVAAARQRLEGKKGEQQRLWQHEELLGHELHPCAAGARLDSIACDSGRTVALRLFSSHGQTDDFRTGIRVVVDVDVEPMYPSAQGQRGAHSLVSPWVASNARWQVCAVGYMQCARRWKWRDREWGRRKSGPARCREHI